MLVGPQTTADVLMECNVTTQLSQLKSDLATLQSEGKYTQARELIRQTKHIVQSADHVA
jgi:hypothetical protein